MANTKTTTEGLEWTGRPFGGFIDDIKRELLTTKVTSKTDSILKP